MARLPKGYELRNERIEGDCLVYDVRIARWRMALLVLAALRRANPKVRFRAR